MKKAFALLLLPAMAMLTACTPATTPDQSAQSSQTTASISIQSNQTMQSSDTNSLSQATTMATPPPANNPGQDPQLLPPQPADTVAIMETDFGTIKFRLFTQDVPTLTTNFIQLAQQNKYNGTPFHRVVKDFMIQGGDFENRDGTGGYSYKGPGTFLANEINPAYHHLYGTVSMAKTSDPVSIGSQFFIVTNKDGVPSLDGGYSPIGQVYSGMDVAEKIQNLQTPGTEQPSQLISLKKVIITTYADDQAGKVKG